MGNVKYRFKNFVPHRIRIPQSWRYETSKLKTAVIIPTYAPSSTTYELVASIIKWYPTFYIVLVDDCTPAEKKDKALMRRLSNIGKKHHNYKMLRTPQNALKAGALNYGLKYIIDLKKGFRVVFTMDDDIKIDCNTLYIVKKTLYSLPHIGAVCSSAKVLNKNVNILTRLQSLEYNSFNITKIADNSLFNGPLVMQGMLTGFRMSALKQVNGFTTGHLIEDYDITARLKKVGWKVKIAEKALAWTNVPEDLQSLWKQRIRWTYGGVNVVRQFWKNIKIVFQDVVGHLMFISLMFLVVLSFFLNQSPVEHAELSYILLILAITQFLVSLIYNLVSLSFYEEGDFWDWILKLSVFAEFVYANVLSFVLIGVYLFFLYQKIIGRLVYRVKKFYSPYNFGLSLFQKFGYSSTWGTKQIVEKGGIKL